MSRRTKSVHPDSVALHPTNGGHSEPTQDQIAHLAYELWLQRGCPIGSPEEDWTHAEMQLREQRQPATLKVSSAKG